MTSETLNIYTNRISNANPTQLIVIMYDMAMDYFKDSKKAIEADNKEECVANLKNAKRVVNNLSSVLDMNYPVSKELEAIYLFINNTAMKAIATYDMTDIDKCVEMLDKLRQSFAQVAKEDSRGPVMANTQQVYAGLTYGKGTLNETMQQDYNRGFKI